MIGRETRMLLRHYLEQGTSKSALARQLIEVIAERYRGREVTTQSSTVAPLHATR